MQVELRLGESNRLIATIDMAELQAIPQPGMWMDWQRESFLILQRRHRYQLRQGCYELATIALMVKRQVQPLDAQWWNGRWVIGDPRCAFNARSPLLRCAVLPEGPCATCNHFSDRS